jgi:hypothetical protein
MKVYFVFNWCAVVCVRAERDYFAGDGEAWSALIDLSRAVTLLAALPVSSRNRNEAMCGTIQLEESSAWRWGRFLPSHNAGFRRGNELPGTELIDIFDFSRRVSDGSERPDDIYMPNGVT